jgi:hypothetical protein
MSNNNISSNSNIILGTNLNNNLDQIGKGIISMLCSYLVLHGGLSSQVGLMRGRLGLSLVLFSISDIPTFQYLHSVSVTILEEIYEDVDQSLNISYESGTIGFGTYFYLISKYGFLSVLRQGVMEELDLIIYKHLSFGKISDISLNTGSIGLLNYLLIKNEDEVLRHDSQSSYITVNMIMTCLDSIFDYFEESDHQSKKDDFLLFIQMYNVLSSIGENIYPQVVTDLKAKLHSKFERSQEELCIDDANAIANENISIYMLISLYDRSRHFQKNIQFCRRYEQAFRRILAKFLAAPTFDKLLILLRNMLNLKYNITLFPINFLINDNLFVEVLNHYALFDIYQEEMWLCDGMSEILLLIRAISHPATYLLYMDVYYLNNKYEQGVF